MMTETAIEQLDRFLQLGRSATLMIHGVSRSEMFELMEAGKLESLKRETRTVYGEEDDSYFVADVEVDDVAVTLFSDDFKVGA